MATVAPRPSGTGLLGDWRVRTAALLALALAFFTPTLVSYHTLWLAVPYTHGYLVAAAAAWLLWRERGAFQPHPGWAPAVYATAVLSLLWLAGTVTTIQFVGQAALPLMLLAWSGAAFGPRMARRLLPITLIFMFAVPMWASVTGPLQWMTVASSGILLSIMHISATIEANMIHLTAGSFVVEGDCAGYSFFVAGVPIGAVYAHRFLRRWRTQLAFVALAAALSIVSNWIRVTSLIVIGHVTEMEAAVIYDHGTYGWVIFLFCLIALFATGRLFERYEATRPSTGNADLATDAAPVAAEDTPPVTSTWRSVLVATAMLLIGPLALVTFSALPERPVPPLALSPSSTATQLGADDSRPYSWSPAFAGADARHQSTWAIDGAPVAVDRLEYMGQTQGAELIGDNNRIASFDAIVGERLFGPIGPHRRFVLEAIVRDAEAHVLVWYWYRVGGIETASPLKAKLLELLAFFRRTTLSELVAVSTACGPADCQEASEVLAAFLTEE